MNQDRMLQVLVAPHVSEKATLLAESAHQHVFKVLPDATKLEIRKAVEALFSVQVKEVRVVNIKGKSKMFGRRPGKRNGLRKAYVTLREGSDIEFNGAE
ncbi:50S ribosomal protein L23 [Acidihalobacter yilgarnensis]|uniref:Large ribosomal subunit protein uL23 n=1 Tax=Acidihalobacter yilgarnensis TaxID=2819280 RepID=A0A1D8ITA6_9GAMM|nr:50S ribosomal protein L23 [Acidihalobacter yilgarnensis]AOU99719.1 50S ribosomal protein L23 [Acidihalobacter yilgarnensis]